MFIWGNCRWANVLNGAGLMVQKIYEELPKYFENICLDVFVIMPNHFHCIIEIMDFVGVESISTQIDINELKRVDMESTPYNNSKYNSGI